MVARFLNIKNGRGKVRHFQSAGETYSLFLVYFSMKRYGRVNDTPGEFTFALLWLVIPPIPPSHKNYSSIGQKHKSRKLESPPWAGQTKAP